MRTARPVLTPWLWRKTMISRICIPSCQALAIFSRRFGPIPSTDSKSAGLSLITASTSAPKCPTSFFANTGPTPFTKPPPRYRSMPSLVVGGTAFSTVALNWSPCSLSRTHHPLAVSHSPALTDGKEPRTVTSSRYPRTFTRSTANPLSSLKKVPRSTSPAISSEEARGCGEESLILLQSMRLELAFALRVGLSWHAKGLRRRQVGPPPLEMVGPSRYDADGTTALVWGLALSLRVNLLFR